MGTPMMQAAVTTVDEETRRGYVTDVPYVHAFHPYLAPALLDHVAVLWGFAPPSREDTFAYCDLGCGQGVTAAILAATHPGGSFHGVDFMPSHIEHAQRFCREAGVSNAFFRCSDFASVARMDLPQFDYIVCHGVYTWVSAEVQREIRNFIDAHLKPQGLAYISYNAMPGWAGDVPFKYLVRALGRISPGDSEFRITAGLELIQALVAAKVPALVDSAIVKRLQENGSKYSPSYLVHEYMHAHGCPLFVTEVREAMSTIGLTPVGSATLMENFDSYVLGGQAREMLASIADPNVRELVRDYYISQRFRRDVFVRHGLRLSPEQQRSKLLATAFSLMCPPEKVAYTVRTPAGSLRFDNETARAIVALLRAGPCPLTDLIQNSGLDEQDVLANTLALSAGRFLRPVEKTPIPVTNLNRTLQARLEGPEQIESLALPHGTAVGIRARIMKAILQEDDSQEDASEIWSNRKNGDDSSPAGLGAWRAFLRSQGAL